ncbi:MAG: hypothetical protein COB16_17950 [Rhodobacteraceae bacterium]|nr:MAG: hypothetical protein COB16_17950 [Paracoccaceae bacterium]
MSDGPHRSLPLRPKWREVAKRASKDAFDFVSVREALEPALLGDCRAELPSRLIGQISSIVEGGDLLSQTADDQQASLLNIRDDLSVNPLGASVIECVMMSLSQGNEGKDVLEDGIKTALFERAMSNARTIEEHYKEKASAFQGSKVRQQLGEAIDGADCFGRIAASIIGNAAAQVTPKIPVHDGVEEGPPL